MAETARAGAYNLVYINSRGPLADPALRFDEIKFKPRLFFTIAISGRPLSSSSRRSRTWARCTGNTRKRSASLLTHELVRINGDAHPAGRSAVAALPAGSKSGWPLYRGARRRRHPACDPCRAGAAEPVPFLPVVQALLSAFRPTDITLAAESNGPSSYWRIVSCPSPRLGSMSASARRARSPPHSSADRPNPELLSSQSRLIEGVGGGRETAASPPDRDSRAE